MKDEKPPTRIVDVELEPDALERLEQAAKRAFRQQPAGTGKPRRAIPLKPKRPRPIRRP